MRSLDTQQVTIEIDDAHRVSGLLLTPERARACYVLAHGAGAGMAHPFMAAVADALAQRAIASLRYQFPYMEQRSKRRPPRAGAGDGSSCGSASVAPSTGRASDRGRQIIRRAHDIAGAGCRCAPRCTRSCFSGLSSSPREAPVD
jgi:hypothetical protein